MRRVAAALTNRVYNRFLGAGSAGSEARERLFARLVDREDAIQSGDLEDLRDVLIRADECERAAGGTQALDAADEHTERGRVDEGRLRQVDDKMLLAVLDHLDETLLELGRG